MTRVLVTGSSGFVGSSVIAALAERDELTSLVAADIRPPTTRIDSVDYRTLDVTDAGAVEALFAETVPEVVVHLASIVTPPPGLSDDVAYRVDVGGTHHVVESALKHQVRRVVVTSSGAAYGYHHDNPEWITEDEPLRGNDAFSYAKHKRLVEEYLAEVRVEHPELEQTVLRVGTILGKSVDNQITALFRQNRLLKIAGATSPFVFVWDSDVVRIIVQAVTGTRTGIYNVAGDGSLTMDELAHLLGVGTITLPDWFLRLVLGILHPLKLSRYGPEQTLFLKHRPVLDNTKLITEFGYRPRRTSAEAFEAWRAAQADR